MAITDFSCLLAKNIHNKGYKRSRFSDFTIYITSQANDDEKYLVEPMQPICHYR
jgi:hypothetical protein